MTDRAAECNFCRERDAVVVVTDRDGDDIALCAEDYEALDVDVTLLTRPVERRTK